MPFGPPSRQTWQRALVWAHARRLGEHQNSAWFNRIGSIPALPDSSTNVEYSWPNSKRIKYNNNKAKHGSNDNYISRRDTYCATRKTKRRILVRHLNRQNVITNFEDSYCVGCCVLIWTKAEISALSQRPLGMKIAVLLLSRLDCLLQIFGSSSFWIHFENTSKFPLWTLKLLSTITSVVAYFDKIFEEHRLQHWELNWVCKLGLTEVSVRSKVYVWTAGRLSNGQLFHFRSLVLPWEESSAWF